MHAGIIAVNVSTFIGYYQKGVLGALSSTFGFVFPSLVIIIIIAAFIQNFASLAIVQHALAGLRVGVCVLVLTSVYKLIKNGVKDGFGIAMFIFCVCAVAVYQHFSRLHHAGGRLIWILKI